MKFNYFKNKLQKIKVDFLTMCFTFLLFFSFFSYSQSLCEQLFSINRAQRAANETKGEILSYSAYENVRKSVWKIYIDKMGSGTGFFISPNQFITNFHVIAPWLKDAKISDISLGQEGHPQTLKVQKILNLSADYDLALLEVSPSETSSYLTLGSRPVTAKDTLFILGYPDGNFADITSVGDIHSFEYFDQIYTEFHSPISGVSGSPVVNQQGQLTGVISKGQYNIISSVKRNDLKNFIQEGSLLNCRDFSCIEEELNNVIRRAKEGGIPAQIYVSFMYASGNVVEQYFEEAFYWFKRAANQGEPYSQYLLGEMYRQGKGKGEEPDYEKVFYWFKRAANQGELHAQVSVAVMYMEGKEVEKNLKQAIYWLRKLAEQGYTAAQSTLDDLLNNQREDDAADVSGETVGHSK